MDIVNKYKVKNNKKRFRISPTRVIVLGFAILIFVGAFLLCLPISHNNFKWFSFIDALFTSTSAVCVTGLVVVDTAAQFSVFGQIVILFLIQIGGLGVMTCTTLLFIMIGKRVSLKNRLLIQESLSENRLQGVVKLIQKILLLTFGIEFAGALILMCSFIPRYGAGGIFPSIFISISAFCNAGFDILGVLENSEFGSLTAFVTNAYVCLPIIALIVLGGLGFMVIMDTSSAVLRRKRLGVNAKIVLITTLVLIIGGWIFYAVSEWNNNLKDLSVGGKILASLFQSVTPRTAGFNTIDQSTMTPASYIITLLFMFIGASPASTGGGIKTTTLAVLFIIAGRTLQGEKDVNLHKSKINNMAIRKAITIIIIATTVIFFNTILILLIEQKNNAINAQNTLFEVTSAFATVGLSMGITAELGVASKLILGLTMFIGRVGALTIGASIAKSSIEKKSRIEYTDAKILIG